MSGKQCNVLGIDIDHNRILVYHLFYCAQQRSVAKEIIWLKKFNFVVNIKYQIPNFVMNENL